MTRRVAVTGMGIVTCYGIGTAVTWGKILAGEPGIRPITLFDTTDYRTTRAGEFTDSAGRALEAISRHADGPRLEPAVSRARRRARGVGPAGDRLVARSADRGPWHHPRGHDLGGAIPWDVRPAGARRGRDRLWWWDTSPKRRSSNSWRSSPFPECRASF